MTCQPLELHGHWRIAVCLAFSSVLAACHLVQWAEDVSRRYSEGTGASRACKPWSPQEENTEWNVIFPVVFPSWQILLSTINLLSFKDISALMSEQIPFYIRSCCLFHTCNLHLKRPWWVLGNKSSHKHVLGCALRVGTYSVLWNFFVVLRKHTYNLPFNAYTLPH